MTDTDSVPISLNFAEATQVGESEWELPPWGTAWNRAVYPFMVATSEGHLYPLGTAFAFSKLNHVFTARHNVEDGLKRFHPDGDRFVRQGLEAARALGKLGHTQFAVVSQGPNPRVGDVTLDVRAINSIHAAPPTDLLVGNILNRDVDNVPTIVPQISFAPPRIGEVVRCVGFCDSEVPQGGLPVGEVRARRLNPYDHLKHRLLVIEAQVESIFLEGLAPGFAAGPCFTLDVEVPHGMSGGPIFNSSGAICGAVYSGATLFFGRPTAVGALFYPIFLLPLSFGLQMARGLFTLNATDRPIAELVASQAIRTDGAEEKQLHFSREDDGIRVGASFNREDADSIFENLEAFQAGRPAPLLHIPGAKAFSPNLDHPLVRERRGLGAED